MHLDLSWDLSLEWSTITSITLPMLIGVASHFECRKEYRRYGGAPRPIYIG